MARVSYSEVDKIIDVDPNITDYSAFISVASLLVDDISAGDSSISEDRLKEIERWLSAHFLAIRDMRASDEKAGKVSMSYQYKLGLNLQVTMYGQQAMMLDSSGYLSRLNKDGVGDKAVASVTVSKKVSVC